MILLPAPGAAYWLYAAEQTVQARHITARQKANVIDGLRQSVSFCRGDAAKIARCQSFIAKWSARPQLKTRRTA